MTADKTQLIEKRLLQQRLGEEAAQDQEARRQLRAALDQIDNAMQHVRCPMNLDCLNRARHVFASVAASI